ncbi:MAG: CvpA family protein [Sterolibacterium sp.]|nr:CvpA family protein [Sterolibacterium sp.]
MGDFTWLDLLILATLLFSTLLGGLRGILSEVLSLLAWLVAFVAARLCAGAAASLLETFLHIPGDSSLRHIVGFVAVFAGVLILFFVIRLLLSSLLRAMGLGPLDRLLGALFGVARGLLVAWVGVLLCGLTSLPEQPWWREARLTPPLETAVIASKSWLPLALAEKIHYRRPAITA